MDRALSWQSMKGWLWPVRDHVCAYCGKKLRYKEATVDHFKPVVAGGKHEDENLLLACGPCNNRKGETEFKSLEEARAYLRKPR